LRREWRHRGEQRTAARRSGGGSLAGGRSGGAWCLTAASRCLRAGLATQPVEFLLGPLGAGAQFVAELLECAGAVVERLAEFVAFARRVSSHTGELGRDLPACLRSIGPGTVSPSRRGGSALTHADIYGQVYT
jgi:hypothetical protein